MPILFISAYNDIIYLMRRRRSILDNQNLVRRYISRLRLLGINPSSPDLDEITRILIIQAIENINTGRALGYNSQAFAPNTRFNEYGLSVITSRARSNVIGLNSIGLTLTFNGNVRTSIGGGRITRATPEFIAFQNNMRRIVPVNGIVNR